MPWLGRSQPSGAQTHRFPLPARCAALPLGTVIQPSQKQIQTKLIKPQPAPAPLTVESPARHPTTSPPYHLAPPNTTQAHEHLQINAADAYGLGEAADILWRLSDAHSALASGSPVAANT
jgi:hypothetical protein